MSTRALKKLTSDNFSAIPDSSHSSGDDEEDKISTVAVNRFQFLDEEESVHIDDSKTSENAAKVIKKSKNKKKARKIKPQSSENINIDFDGSDLNSQQTQKSQENAAFTSDKGLLTIEYRNLNMENELKRIFGSVVGRQAAPTTRRRTATGGGRLVKTKLDVRVAKTGLSMVLVRQISNNVNLFKFEHNQAYQAAQNLFWEAADSLSPELMVEILKQHPFHLDTLLQMSEIYRINEDFSTARDLVERAISACQAAFHPLFNVAANNSRLDYRQRENRSFFLALHKHMLYIAQKVCFRTALEFCKLIFSLDQQDPLGVLLFMDYYCLRCKQYDYLIQLYYLLEGERNLSQLPNFCFSLALAHHFKATVSRQEKDFEEADSKLREALCKFPTFLPVLLEKCQVEPDAKVGKQMFYNSQERASDGQGLKILYEIYARRTVNIWRERPILDYLERNVHRMVENGDFTSKNEIFTAFSQNRKTRYAVVPENVVRHVILTGDEMQPLLLSYLPSQRNFNSYDPCPPADGQHAYERPTPHAVGRRDQSSILGSFLRSLMPNYDPEAEPAPVNNDFQQSVQGVLRAMRDLLADIQVAAPDREDNNDDNWDDDNQVD